MVRIKHRYLLAHILYPNHPSPPLSTSSSPPLPPIVRFRPPTPNSLTPQLLLRAIREQVALLYGDYGAGVTAAGLSIKYLSPATSTFILRCPRAHYQLVWAALTYMTHLPALGMGGRSGGGKEAGGNLMGGDHQKKGEGGGPCPCVIRVVRVSGTIRKAEEEAVRRARGDILRAKRGEEGGGLEGMFGSGEGGGEGEEEGIVDVDVDVDEDEDDGEEEGEEEQ
ncbi:hypothetical protein MMC17_007660 [Xylographa soralifera]|nr:hypothetical protein [Xylographa soralifera]